MKAPAAIDPDMLVTIEILQHAAEIVSRLPLAAMKAHLRQVAPDDPALQWYEAAARLVESGQLLDLDAGKLSALEARIELPPPGDTIADDPGATIPDDWTLR